MHPSFRFIVLGLLASAFTVLLLKRAQAGDDDYFPPVTDKATLQECGSCHLAFPPSMLPAASWKRMMAGLEDHFGDDASVDAGTAATITRYLVRNAGDARDARRDGRLLRGLDPNAAPLRITELPKWRREHRKVARSDWTSKEVGTKANCAGCHVDAAQGYFDDE
ncbi:MAG: cytochrome C [Burkholderiales bacterium]|nr:MAG: cytochrome C [Burkholderiales bacterium]